MRLYVPATLDLLAQWRAGGAVPPGDPGAAGGFVAPDESEDGEYAALMAAADAAVGLLPGGAGRRVVLVVETATPDGPVPAVDWAAVHADAADRPAGADPDEDLGWFAIQEIPDLVDPA
ncbi:MAG TPA: hypothetical protein VGE38_08765 [Nocardioides sp.]|uniref:DUF6912 family protein n=1 Tax=Nocardioides sp. TaxID=35761 RepID=UPI002ED77906